MGGEAAEGTSVEENHPSELICALYTLVFLSKTHGIYALPSVSSTLAREAPL